MSPTPLGARILAGAGAAGVALFFGLNVPLGLASAGCPGAGATLALLSFLLAAFLGLLAAAPDRLQALVRRRTALDLGDAGHVAAAVVMAGALFFILGWGGGVGAALALEHALGGCDLGGTIQPTPEGLVRGVLLNLIVFTLPTILYVGVVHGLGPRATLEALGVRADGAGRALATGAGLALAFLVLLALAVAAVAPFLPEEALQNDQALAIAKSVTLPAAIVLALGSGIGEEVFFRGFLQPRFGLVATSVVFALAHASYGSVSEVVVVLALSLALGALYRATGNLLAPMAAHATFNFVQLLAGMYLEPPAG